MTPERLKKLRRKEFWMDGLTYFLLFVSFSWSGQADEDPLGFALILLGVYYLLHAVSIIRAGTPRISELFSKDLVELRRWEEKQKGEGNRYDKTGGMAFLVMALAFFGGAVWMFADRRFGEIPGFKVLFSGSSRHLGHRTVGGTIVFEKGEIRRINR
jgi:hypothetical protein